MAEVAVTAADADPHSHKKESVSFETDSFHLGRYQPKRSRMLL